MIFTYRCKASLCNFIEKIPLKRTCPLNLLPVRLIMLSTLDFIVPFYLEFYVTMQRLTFFAPTALRWSFKAEYISWSPFNRKENNDEKRVAIRLQEIVQGKRQLLGMTDSPSSFTLFLAMTTSFIEPPSETWWRTWKWGDSGAQIVKKKSKIVSLVSKSRHAALLYV